MNCEVCGSKQLIKVLDLGDHPLCDELIEIGEKRKNVLYPIKIKLCQNCKTALQEFNVDKKLLFPDNYHYRSKNTKDVVNGMKKLVQVILKNYGSIQNKKILDIGCNDGSLLDFFKEYGAITFGVEPTNASKSAIKNGHTIFNEYFTFELVNKFLNNFGRPDIITFTNVFAHINNLPELINNLKLIIKNHDTLLVIENHYLGSVLKYKQFDTFYHEHPRTYSLNSFVNISKLLKMNIDLVEFPERYGGNIRVFLNKKKLIKAKNNLKKYLDNETNLLEGFINLNNYIDSWKINKKNEIINAFQRHGPLVGKAFPGRAAIPIKLLNLDNQIISAVHELDNSEKCGHYIPGTNIPIKKDKEYDKSYRGPILNFAWHIKEEIHAYLKSKEIYNEIIDII